MGYTISTNKRLLIFDCDGTLVDSEILACKVFPAVWATMGIEMTPDFFLSNFVGTGHDAEIVRSIKARLPPDGMAIADHKFHEEIAKNLKAVRGISSLLKRIQGPVCVASNSTLEYLDQALKITGLAQVFSSNIFSAHQVEKAKPAPDVFLFAAKNMGYEPKDCIVVEDSYFGIQGAKNAGMTTIGFFGGLHCTPVVRDRVLKAKADFYCENIQELEQVLLT